MYIILLIILLIIILFYFSNKYIAPFYSKISSISDKYIEKFINSD